MPCSVCKSNVVHGFIASLGADGKGLSGGRQFVDSPACPVGCVVLGWAALGWAVLSLARKGLAGPG